MSKVSLRPETLFSPHMGEIDVRDRDGKRCGRIVTLHEQTPKTIHVDANSLDPPQFLKLVKALGKTKVCDRVTFQDTASIRSGSDKISLTPMSKLATGRTWYEREGIVAADVNSGHRCVDTFQDVSDAPMRNVTRFVWECLRPLLVERGTTPRVDQRHGETLVRVGTRISPSCPLSSDDMTCAYRQAVARRPKQMQQHLGGFLLRHGFDKHDVPDALRSCTSAQSDWFHKYVPVTSSSKSARPFGRSVQKTARAAIDCEQDAAAIELAEVNHMLLGLGLLHVPSSLSYVSANSSRTSDTASAEKVKRASQSTARSKSETSKSKPLKPRDKK